MCEHAYFGQFILFVCGLFCSKLKHVSCLFLKLRLLRTQFKKVLFALPHRTGKFPVFSFLTFCNDNNFDNNNSNTDNTNDNDNNLDNDNNNNSLDNIDDVAVLLICLLDCTPTQN